MATTAGAVSAGVVGSTSAQVISAVATGGTSPYTYQWYKSLVSGFTPGPSNDIDGATTLEYTDQGLIPGTQYYYKMISTDSSATPVSATSAQLSILTESANQSPNQFVQSPYLGMLDLKYNPDTIAAQIDDSEVDVLIAGQAVKFTSDDGGLPKVTKVTSDSDIVAGFLTYNIKNKGFVAFDTVELSMDQNVMYLMSTAAINRGARVMVDLTTKGGVTPATSGKPVCGFAIDSATAGGQLIRIKLMTPSYSLMP